MIFLFEELRHRLFHWGSVNIQRYHLLMCPVWFTIYFQSLVLSLFVRHKPQVHFWSLNQIPLRSWARGPFHSQVLSNFLHHFYKTYQLRPFFFLPFPLSSLLSISWTVTYLLPSWKATNVTPAASAGRIVVCPTLLNKTVARKNQIWMKAVFKSLVMTMFIRWMTCCCSPNSCWNPCGTCLCIRMPLKCFPKLLVQN